MLVEALPLFGFPNGATTGLDMTADFAPLFFGLWVVLGLCSSGSLSPPRSMTHEE